MTCVAAEMMVSSGQNQISDAELLEVVEKYYNLIPSEISKSVPASLKEVAIPLRDRMADDKESVEAVLNDVRTTALLTVDSSASGFFKFGHKSFLEYQVAALLGQIMTNPDTELVTIARGVGVARLLGLAGRSPEIVRFVAEIVVRDWDGLEDTNLRGVARNLATAARRPVVAARCFVAASASAHPRESVEAMRLAAVSNLLRLSGEGGRSVDLIRAFESLRVQALSIAARR